MKLYTTIEPTPSRIHGLLHLILNQKSPIRSQLELLFHPMNLRKSDETDAFQRVLNVLMDLELVEEVTEGDDTILRANPDLGKASQLRERLPIVAARSALQSEVGGQRNHFARMCAWFLHQPVTGIPQGHGAIKNQLEIASQKTDWKFDVHLDNRLDMVIYWAKYLGLIAQLRDERCRNLIADPTRYLTRHLGLLLPSEETVPIRQFRQELGKLCPVLDGGAIHEEVREVYEIERADNAMSPALGYALSRLEHQKLIKMERINDAPAHRILIYNDEKITDVRRLSKGTS